jgi:hypothetical protein
VNILKSSLILRIGLAFTLLPACSNSGAPKAASNAVAPSEAGAADDEVVSCQTDPRVSPYTLPLTLTGPRGYGVTLSERSPDPSAKGLNQWTVAVTDAAGALVVGANLVLGTSMPDHGHSSPSPIAPPTDAQGSSVVPGLDFFMAGVWRIQVDVYPALAPANADPTDSVAFSFCIEG